MTPTPHLVDRLRVDGWVMLDERLPADLVERMRQRFDELLAERVAVGPTNRGANRFQMVLPFEPPFADPLLYEHPRVLEVLEHAAIPESRQLLETLANGLEGAWLTREARASRERMARPAR